MKITKKSVAGIKGKLVRIRWSDASADATDDGSPKELLRDHDSCIYDTFGLVIGFSKGDLVLTSDRRVGPKEEYRGKLNIPKMCVIDLEVIL
jgi:hypothetical protein|tara:strand:+ start:530 stop:805 length:276 start_codon:yes stop_codon:yes gene_type:complete